MDFLDDVDIEKEAGDEFLAFYCSKNVVALYSLENSRLELIRQVSLG